ncbi:hypothetical protein GCM10011609_69880 [Lentzea pudingi]|uniref:Uncharacterized protein n=1 Tax=Lentzea pudingi TaxID=1789439 RepID=A0ABQ2IRS7_9PSEU|nr:hypothetical protein GCM10011609_69880 [Lentzea pudingi]
MARLVMGPHRPVPMERRLACGIAVSWRTHYRAVGRLASGIVRIKDAPDMRKAPAVQRTAGALVVPTEC